MHKRCCVVVIGFLSSLTYIHSPVKTTAIRSCSDSHSSTFNTVRVGYPLYPANPKSGHFYDSGWLFTNVSRTYATPDVVRPTAYPRRVSHSLIYDRSYARSHVRNITSIGVDLTGILGGRMAGLTIKVLL